MSEELRQLESIAAALGDAPPELAAIDLVEDVRRACDGPEPALRGGGLRRGLLALAGVAAAAAVVSVAVVTSRVSADDEFRPKAAVAAHQPDRWVGVQAFRVGDDGNAVPLSGQMAASDGLVFAYTNLGPQPFAYAMVFAVDPAGKVHWFYPAFEREGQDPTSIPVHGGRAGVQLPDLVRHDYATGRLVIYGLFSREDMRVSDIEATVRDAFVHGRWRDDEPPRLAPNGAAQHVLMTQVTR